MNMNIGRFFLGLALIATAGAALASSEAECEAAIKSAQEAAESDAIVENSEAREEEISDLLARAGEAGIEKHYERCLELVKQARDVVGPR